MVKWQHKTVEIIATQIVTSAPAHTFVDERGRKGRPVESYEVVEWRIAGSPAAYPTIESILGAYGAAGWELVGVLRADVHFTTSTTSQGVRMRAFFKAPA